MTNKILFFSALTLFFFTASAQKNTVSISDDEGKAISLKEGISMSALPEYLVLKSSNPDLPVRKTNITHVSGGQGKNSHEGNSKLFLTEAISKNLKEGDQLVIEVYLDNPDADDKNEVLFINLPVKA